MKRKVTLLIAALLGTAYAIYLFIYFTSAMSGASGDTELIGSGLATMLVLPHFVLTLIAVLFNWLSFIFKFRWAALVAGILYAVAIVLFMAYFMFVVVEMILCFVGFATMKKKKS